MSSLTCDAAASATDHNDSLSRAVIEAVADEEEVEPTDIPPLYTAIDPEALDSLFQSPDAGEVTMVGQARFTYHGYEVSVSADGQVTLTE